VYEDTATVLFGMPGVRVVEAETERDGVTTVYLKTADLSRVACPDCGSLPERQKQNVFTRVRDVPFGDRRIRVVWDKRRWVCPSTSCERVTFTESLPGLLPRKRLTTRLRQALVVGVADGGRTVAEVAETHGVSWHTAHTAFVDAVDPGLSVEPEPVEHLGVDEVRRGRPRWEKDPETGETTQIADRWHAGFTDLGGGQGLLGQVEGRTGKALATWLGERDPAWRAGIQTVSMDLCTAFRSGIRQALPDAKICADAFHLVQLANKMVTSVRWRVVREHYGRRGKEGDPEYGIKRLLMRNLEDLGLDQLGKLWNTLVDHSHLADLHIAWIAKEHLRDLLALRITRSGTKPTEADAQDRWSELMGWCETNQHIPELVTFTKTLTAWRNEIINAVLLGVSNAGSEGVNRIQKLDNRSSFGYRNPDNQRRRARVAAGRSARRPRRRRPVKRRVPQPSRWAVQIQKVLSLSPGVTTDGANDP
jgi:transposase